MRTRHVIVAIIAILALALAGCAQARPVADDRPGASGDQPVYTLYYAGVSSAPEDAMEDGPQDTPGTVRSAVELVQRSGLAEPVGDPREADVLVLNGRVPDPEGLGALVREGTGLVLVLGPEVTAEQVTTLLGQPVSLDRREDPLSLAPAEGAQDPLLEDIVWGSAPQVRERSAVQGTGVQGTGMQGMDVEGLDGGPLIVGYESGEAVLVQLQVGQGQVYLLTAHLDGANPQFQEWPYFNYLIYALTARAAGGAPLAFGDYPASPVPHAREQRLLVGLLAVMLVTASIAFVLVRRYSRAHPEALDELVASRADFQAREAGTAWEEIGFHRPVAGFMFAMMMGILLFIPLIIYQNLVLPTFILPSAQAMGLWGRVTQMFGLAWTLFDVGTSVAFIKFFAQYRVRDPRRAVQYGQLFVWWQALSGAFQVALVVMLAGTVVTRTSYALYAWVIIGHTLIQIPGFYAVMRHALYAQQRLDYAQVLDNFLMLVWPMLAQPIFVTLLLAWGRRTPGVGAAMGGAIGLGLAAYAVEVLNFGLGLWLYRRLGYNARVLFLAHFDRPVLLEAFRFGVLDMGGSLVFAAGQAIEVLITQTRLVNYAEIWGNWMMANNFVFAFSVLQNLTDGVMPAVSEAISHGRRVLGQYYAAMTYKWSAVISAFIAAVLLAVADRFILGSSGPEFARAAVYVIPLIFWGSVQHLGIIGDTIAIGSNKPALKMAMIAGEQALRIVLALLLVERFQVAGLIVAYLIALLVRGIAVYFVNSRLCFPLRYYPWPSLVAPLLAGALHYVILRWLTGLIWRNEPITSIIIFLIGILFSYPIYTFFYGLLGGWDDATLDELGRAAEMQPALRFMARLFHRSTALGARFSPLHNRFPIAIRAEAMEEAASLTAEKVNLASIG